LLARRPEYDRTHFEVGAHPVRSAGLGIPFVDRVAASGRDFVVAISIG